jgi:hypothetical protein
MALAVSKDAQLTLFKAVFDPHSPVLMAVMDLIEKGAYIDTSLFSVKITYKGQVYSQALTTGINTLIKGTASDVLKAQARFMLKTFVEAVIGLTLGPVEAVEPQPSWLDKATASNSPPPILKPQDTPATSVPQVPKAANVIAPGTGKPIKLSAATTLGQRVMGTSLGTVYRVVALSPRVKIATNIKGKDVSMRVEATSPTDAELSAIKSLFSWKGTYGSMHMSANTVPVARLIGAVLFSLGVEFDQMVQGAAELEKANA